MSIIVPVYVDKK